MSQLPNGRGNNGDMERTTASDQGAVASQRSSSKAGGSKGLSIETIWDESGFPRRHKSFNAEKDALNERWKSWHRQISSMLLMDGSSWLLCGKPHSGKTQLATECGRDVTNASSSCYYIPFDWMGLEIDSAQQPAATQTVATYGRKLLSPRLLVIDNIEFQNVNQSHLQFLGNLVTMRHDNCLDTIMVTANEVELVNDHLPGSIKQKINSNDGFVKFGWDGF